MKSRWLNIALVVACGLACIGAIIALDVRAHDTFGWRSTISWGMAELGHAHPLVAFAIGGVIFGTIIGLAVHWWGGGSLMMPDPTVQATIDRLHAELADTTGRLVAAERDLAVVRVRLAEIEARAGVPDVQTPAPGPEV